VARLVWHPDAVTDLVQIAQFIGTHAPVFARHFVRRLTRAIDRLQEFPRMGRVFPGQGDPRLRELVYRNYRIVYSIRGETINVLGVLNSAMDIDAAARDRGWYIDGA
jgi:plasmid stabilization system protein ParE